VSTSVGRHGALIAMLTGVAALDCASPSTGPTTQPPPPPPAIRIVLHGRVERGEGATLALQNDSGAVITDSTVWSVSPAGRAQLVGQDSLQFVEAGTIEVTAKVFRTSGSRTTTLDTTVASPPRIVFDLVRQGNRDIYAASLDGGELTRLTADSADDNSPTSASGKLVWVSTHSGAPMLWSMPMTGGVATLAMAGTVTQLQPSLTTDGRTLAYVVVASSVLPRLWIGSVGGADARRHPASAADSSPAIEGHPTWSPDGQRLAFMSTSAGPAAVLVVERDGSGGARQLVGGTRESGAMEPSWSNDGRSIAFTSVTRSGSDIAIVSLNTGDVTPLTATGDCGEPAWLPDGRIVYTQWVSGIPHLRWLDPAHAETVHAIELGDDAAEHAAAVR